MTRYFNSADALHTLKKLAYETALNQTDIRVADVFEDIAKNRIETWVDLIPTADVVERKKGKWIIKDNPGTGWYRVTCSECGEDVTSVIPVIGFFPNAKPIWNFCPNCGSDNREESDNEVV